VDFVAIAAYRNPELIRDSGILTKKYAAKIRKKIETLFAIALSHGHDTLILSALGCGAYHNPPAHIAEIFKAVIYQFGTYFKEIIFAIENSENGNFLDTFKAILDGLEITTGCPIHDLQVVHDVPPCEEAGYCLQTIQPLHVQSFSHPPRCPLPSPCPFHKRKDIHHLFLFSHKEDCPKAGKCPEWSNPSHNVFYSHPEACRQVFTPPFFFFFLFLT
jgi:hypothetical protein